MQVCGYTAFPRPYTKGYFQEGRKRKSVSKQIIDIAIKRQR